MSMEWLSAISSRPPSDLRGYFAPFPQKEERLTTGERVQMPLFIWGYGVLELLGSVRLTKAVSCLSGTYKEPIMISTPTGPAALAALVNPSYAGSSVRP